MSIINDALKKLQQGQTAKVSEKPAEKPGSGYVYATPAAPPEEMPVEQLAPAKNMARSVLTLILALALISGSFVFLCRQVNTYFPDLKGSIRSSFYKLIGRKEPPIARLTAPELPPLAKIIAPATTMPNTSVTLNVHGVMSNGSSNLVLINDQVYQQGDEPVDGVKILKIDLNSITVDNNGKQELIRVNN